MRWASQAFQERVEPGDGEGDPACARPRHVGLDEAPGALVDLPEPLLPGAKVREGDADVEIGYRDAGVRGVISLISRRRYSTEAPPWA